MGKGEGFAWDLRGGLAGGYGFSPTPMILEGYIAFGVEYLNEPKDLSDVIYQKCNDVIGET